MASSLSQAAAFLSLSVSVLFLSAFPCAAAGGVPAVPSAVGVTYSSFSSPSAAAPEHVAAAVQSLKIGAVRLPDSDPTVVRAFAYSNTSLLLTVPNAYLRPIAANRSNALRWLYHHVVPFYPRARISTISVGNDALEASADLADAVLPAIRNLHGALVDLGIRRIAVSTTFSFVNVMTTAFPPSAAEFQEPAAELLIKPLLRFLADTNSSFLVNLYPYNVYRLHAEIPIGYALFQEHPFNFRDDLTTGVRYRNLFDMMVDAVISAMAVAGHENIPVVVTETGWPSSPGAAAAGSDEVDANSAYAEMYLRGLVRHLGSGQGTPLRKEGVAEAYIYELFDREPRDAAVGAGRQWGILYPNMTRKYRVEFSGAATNKKAKKRSVNETIVDNKDFLVFLSFFFLLILQHA